MAEWFGTYYNQEVHFSSAVKCTKGPQVLTSQRRNYYYYMIIINYGELAACTKKNLYMR